MKMEVKNLLIYSSFITALFPFGETRNCVPRTYSYGSNVCVCNSTYCDTIPKVQAPSQGKYIIYISTEDGLRFEKNQGNFKSPHDIRTTLKRSGSTYHINKKVLYQKIFGFGGAFTDSSGINILSLSTPTQDFLLKSYFSSDGIEYTMGRVPIGGTDFSTRPYTYHDRYTGGNLRAFSLAREDLEYKIPLIHRAQSMSTTPLKLVGSCWSPPAWMKTTHRLTGFGSLRSKYYDTYADYHIKFLNEYEKHGTEFWCITTGNQPSIIAPETKRNLALVWTPVLQTKWIEEDLGPSMRSSHPDTCIIAVDDQRFTYPWWLDTTLKDKAASKYINGTAVHWYYDSKVPPTVLEKTHENHPDVFILYTESSEGFDAPDNNKVELGSWTRGERYAHDIIESMNAWVTGWIDWNLALNEEGGPTWLDTFLDAAIIVNNTADEFYKQPMFYALGHFSKFIPPGSVRLGESSSSSNTIETLSVKRPDGSIAVVFLNRELFDEQLTFIDTDRGSVTLNLPGRSISSMIYR